MTLPRRAADPLQTLRERYPGLAALEEPVLRRLVAAAIPVAFPAGKVLFQAGDACEGYLLVLEGTLRVELVAESGHEIVLYRVEPGESCVLTTACLVGRQAYPAEGVVEEPMRGLLLPAAAFDSLLDAAPVFRRFAMAQIGGRLADLLALVSEVAFRRTDTRLAFWLAERAVRQGPEIALTHQAIARELGTAREVVSRLLKELERRGLLRLRRGAIDVLDADRLRGLAEAGRNAAAPGDIVTDTRKGSA